MIRSMTAFARQSRRSDWGELVWELRTVNHRYLELGFRLPEELRALETDCRKTIARHLRRGKIDCSLKVRFADSAATDIQVNEALLESLARRVGAIGALLKRPGKVDPLGLLRWPGVVKDSERDTGPVEQAALAALEEALVNVNQSRRDEGERIASMIVERCDGIATEVSGIRARLPAVRERIRERITSRLQELQADIDQSRLDQELVMLAQKMDVDEELDRLDSHLTETRKVLERSDAVGRRLDFLMQEFNREANTLASKSNDSETTRAALAIKVFVEQMREQVQNVE